MCYYVQSQDMIVTNERDTIECKITRITTEFIHFSVFDKSGILLMRSRLPLSGISHYAKNEVEQTVFEIKAEDQIQFEDYKQPVFRLSLNTGYTYQFGGYKNTQDSYASQLRSLWNLGVEFHYFPSEGFGLGVKYNRLSTDAEDEFDPAIELRLDPTQPLFITSIADEKVTFDYIAISLVHRNILSDDQSVNYFIAGGIIRYKADGKFVTSNEGTISFVEEGETYGVSLGVSYDFRFMENIGLGAGLEINIARITELSLNDLVAPADFSISRVDLTLGIRLFY